LYTVISKFLILYINRTRYKGTYEKRRGGEREGEGGREEKRKKKI
jgi:hypothetical protein